MLQRLAERVVVNQIPVFPLEYLLPSQWVAALAPTYSLPVRFEYQFTLHHSVAQNLCDMKRSTFEIDSVQILSVTTEIAPILLFFYLNGSPIWYQQYGFRVSARATLYSVLNIVVRSNSRSQPVLAVMGYLIYDVEHWWIWRI